MIKRLMYSLVKKYRHSTVPRWIIFTLDIVLFLIAFTITELFIEHSITHNSQYIWVKFIYTFAITMAFNIIIGTHRSIIRHAGMNDIYRVLLACIFPMLIFLAVRLLNDVMPQPIINKSYLLTNTETVMLYSLLMLIMTMARMMYQRIYNDYFRHKGSDKNVVIYGAGAAGIITFNALKQDIHTEYKVVAFIDDDASKINQLLNGVPIMKSRDVLTEKFIKSKNVSQIIIAIPTIKSQLKRAISNRSLDLGLTVKAVPHISKWINDTFSFNQIQEIKIEDLLQRDSIKLDNVNIVREVVDRRILITGAAGSIGSEICRQLVQYKPAQIIMLDQAESPMYDFQFELRNNEPYRNYADHMEFVIANVKDQKRMEEVFEHYRPELVYHAAAYKHVPFMEENPYEAIYVNVFGTKIVADLAMKYGARKFVMVSTDKAVNPTNVMGATKRMAEIYIQSRQSDVTHFVTTRFGNVLGSNGSVIPLFKKQLAAGGPLTVTHRDIIRFFMTIPEACNLVLEAGAMGEGGDIFVFDMGQPVKIYDLAKRMIQLSGQHDIEIKEIGLRPGEKLYEELLANKENTIATHHPKIMRAQVRKYEAASIDKEYAELWTVLNGLDDMKIVSKMKHIVPEFVSNNSKYCALDKQAETK